MEVSRGNDSVRKEVQKAAVLIEALPYIQFLQGKIVLIKLGGSAMTTPARVEEVLRDIVFMEAVGVKPVVVHGGGNAISLRMKDAGIAPRFIEGLRVTGRESIEIVREVLSGINKTLTRQISSLGGRAVGLSDREDNVIKARKLQPLFSDSMGNSNPIDIGFVGEVDRVETKPILKIIRSNKIPVIAPYGTDEDGRVYNINGDMTAGSIAAELKAEKLVFLTDVEGIMTKADQREQRQVLSSLKREEIVRLLKEETIVGGMIPKVTAGLYALEHGVKKIHIIDGRLKHSLLLEIFTDKRIGTEIVS